RPLRRVVPAPAPPETVLAGIRELIEFVSEVGGGRIGYPDVRGRDVFVRLDARDREPYRLRMRIDSYLDAPLRCTFVDDGYRRCATAWPEPEVLGPFRSPDFICMPPVAEFYACHRDRTYRHGEGSFTSTVAAVFAALQADEYAGR